ncbi:nitroreductase family protein [Hymenobacter convexus]|uniref:nitroreductase family protein n=1 Tax=Hymenobacter sp. CA1UV-4 TaxID=3063782 RepID=UPI002713F63F|nr:nitroreductase family protein [Hymenobacter sp. CA1UV-4]MDO7852631.1 nitroreductase family protein [Hymenobacter sp. CA1UV-4]
MKRRDFLFRTALGAGFALLGPLRQAAQARTAGAAAQARWAELVDYARWSPSPHNVQPWKLLVLSKTEARLYYEPARLLPHTDPTSCFTIIGLGMFIESLRIAAAPLGYGLEARHTAEPRLNYAATTPQLFADLRLVPAAQASPVPAFDRELLKQRRTSRLHYDGRPVAAEVQQQLTRLVAAHGHQLACSTEAEMVDFVLDLNRQTLFTDLDDVPVRQELAGLIRTTDAEAHAKKDGLWSRCMGFPGRLMHNFFFHPERFHSPWKRGVLGKVYQHSMHGTSTVAWLQGRFETRADWLQAGTLMQRLWLEMTRHGVYLHPFGSVVTNEAAHRQFLEKVGHQPTDAPLWLLVRLGYSTEPPRSLRLNTQDIFLNATPS